MTVGIMQPYFLPYIGYFQLINAVDQYVIYDDVQFIKGGWINRNHILLNGEQHLINLILSGASSNKKINEIEVQPKQTKLIKVIESAYKKAPHFNVVFPLVLKIMEFENRALGAFLGNSLAVLCKYMSIDTALIFSSMLQKDNALKSQDRVLHIAELLGANSYLNAIGGQDLYDKEDFKNQNINLQFLKSQFTVYPQFRKEFVPHLSILDVLMFNSVEEIQPMLKAYEII